LRKRRGIEEEGNNYKKTLGRKRRGCGQPRRGSRKGRRQRTGLGKESEKQQGGRDIRGIARKKEKETLDEGKKFNDRMKKLGAKGF